MKCAILFFLVSIVVTGSGTRYPEVAWQKNETGGGEPSLSNLPVISYAMSFRTGQVEGDTLSDGSMNGHGAKRGAVRKRVLNPNDAPDYFDLNSLSSEMNAAPYVPPPPVPSPLSSSYAQTSLTGSYAGPPPSVEYDVPPLANSYSSPSLPNTYMNPPPSNSYSGPSPPTSNYASPPPSSLYNPAPPSPSSYETPASNSYVEPAPPSSSDSPEPSHSLASVYTIESAHHKKQHRFKIIPVLVTYGFMMVAITWIFLRVGFFTQIGIAGNLNEKHRQFVDNWSDIVFQPSFNWDSESLLGSVLKAISSTYFQPDA